MPSIKQRRLGRDRETAGVPAPFGKTFESSSKHAQERQILSRFYRRPNLKRKRNRKVKGLAVSRGMLSKCHRSLGSQYVIEVAAGLENEQP